MAFNGASIFYCAMIIPGFILLITGIILASTSVNVCDPIVRTNATIISSALITDTHPPNKLSYYGDIVFEYINLNNNSVTTTCEFMTTHSNYDVAQQFINSHPVGTNQSIYLSDNECYLSDTPNCNNKQRSIGSTLIIVGCCLLVSIILAPFFGKI